MKTEPARKPPQRLRRYCEANGFAGLGLLALLGDTSLSLPALMSDDVKVCGRASPVLFSYLLGYAAWVGAKNGRLSFSDTRGSARTLRHLSPSTFADEEASYKVSEFIVEFYRHDENLQRAEQFFGPFATDVPLSILRERCSGNLVFLFSLCDRWRWSDTEFQTALRQVSEPVARPVEFFYDEEHAFGREFSNYLLVAVLFEKTQCWSDEAALVRWPATAVTLNTATESVRMLVLGADMPDFRQTPPKCVSMTPGPASQSAKRERYITNTCPACEGSYEFLEQEVGRQWTCPDCEIPVTLQRIS